MSYPSSVGVDGDGFVAGMRDEYSQLCCRALDVVNDGGVRVAGRMCVKDRGHDGGEHERKTRPGVTVTTVFAADTPPLMDEFGRFRVELDETINRPGYIEVDGDLYRPGPVAILSFELSSEPADYVKSVATDADFGTFQVRLEGAAKVRGTLQLTEHQARAFAAAILWRFRGERE